MDSILQSIKQLLGVNPEYQYFDNELVIHINSVLMILNQLGIGTENFQITDARETWNDFLGDDGEVSLGAVRSYVFMKTKLLWDPPTSSAVMDAYNRSVNEFEWRLNVRAENDSSEEETENG